MSLVVTNNNMNKHIDLIVGCGILKKEIDWLINKNNWLLNTVYLDSSLHIDLEKLKMSLTTALKKHPNQNTLVFYGACHPLIDDLLGEVGMLRTEGQNCVDILLGNNVFTKELSNGAFFLLEDWALRWKHICKKTFGDKKEIVQQIFGEDRKYVLAIKTPCSGDFTKEAELMAQHVGLPLNWLSVGLDNLETVLNSSIN
jgi:hypothetical protein